MKQLQISQYPNLLDELDLNAVKMCKIIEHYPLTFLKTKMDQVEWKTQFPMFLIPFYNYLHNYGEIPTQSKFYEYYLYENELFFTQNQFTPEVTEALKARIFRTYPSLVRDLHFNIFAKENITDALIIYNKKLDIEEGIDQLIEYNRHLYAINLYTDTARACIGRSKKKSRHTPFENVHYIELPVSLNSGTRCGAFFLYGRPELSQINQILRLNS